MNDVISFIILHLFLNERKDLCNIRKIFEKLTFDFTEQNVLTVLVLDDVVLPLSKVIWNLIVNEVLFCQKHFDE